MTSAKKSLIVRLSLIAVVLCVVAGRTYAIEQVNGLTSGNGQQEKKLTPIKMLHFGPTYDWTIDAVERLKSIRTNQSDGIVIQYIFGNVSGIRVKPNPDLRLDNQFSVPKRSDLNHLALREQKESKQWTPFV